MGTTAALTAEQGRRPAARHRRRRATREQVIAVGLITVMASVAAIVALDASPTGSAVMDAVYRAGLVSVTTLAASRARRWSLVIAAGLVTLGSGGWFWVAGVAALALSVLLAWQNRRDRVVGAAAGALIGLCALHLQWPTTTFATSLWAAAAVVPLWISGYRTSSSRVRRRILIGIALAVVVTLAGLAGAIAFGVGQRNQVSMAIDEALAAADTLGTSSPGSAVAGFRAAGARFDGVAEAADVWWMAPARALPVIGPNVRTVRDASAAGATLNDVAAELAGKVDYERLQLDGGGIDLQVLGTYQAPLRKAAAALAASDDALQDASSPWVAGPIRDRISELDRRVGRARSDAETARLSVDTAPALLGADGPRRYLMLLGNTAEARDIGGHLGNWAEVVAEGGRLRVIRVGRPYDLFGPTTSPAPTLTDADTFPRSLVEMNPTDFPQNWGASPDLPTVARLAAELYPQTPGGTPIDGVFYADPEAFAGILAITGPVVVPGTDVTLTSDNAVDFFEKGQFALFGDDGDDAVSDVIRSTLDRLTTDRLPSPRSLADTFGPVVDAGRLQFVSLRPDEMPLIERLRLDGAVVAPEGTDLLAVLTRNANPSKIDAYLERTIDDRIRWNPDTGETSATVTVTLTNTAPAAGLPDVVANPPPGAPPGTNRTQLSFLTPFDATGATIDGARVGFGTQSESGSLQRHSLVLDVAPGASRTVAIELKGQVEGPDYRFRWVSQPLARPDRARLLITSTGAPFRGGSASGSVSLPGTGDADLTLRTER